MKGKFYQWFSSEETPTIELYNKNVELSKKDLEKAFKHMYMEALRTFESNRTYKGGDIDIILGTSKGFMNKISRTFDEEDKVNCEVDSPDNFKENVYYYLFKLEPKCLMDVLWIGHFLGSKAMSEWVNGNFKMGLPDESIYTDE